MTAQTSYRIQNWLVILIINIFLALGAWQMNKINTTLEKLNDSVIRVTSAVENINEKLITVDKRLDKHDEKFEKLGDEERKYLTEKNR